MWVKSYSTDEVSVGCNLWDGSFLGEGVERDGEWGRDELGEVEAAAEVFSGEEDGDLDERDGYPLRERSIDADVFLIDLHVQQRLYKQI